ncbi:hypothetical protein F0919_04565 [Taibaiella lutea]|uniref:Lipoprotein n=1 Tax=Taibaiella lutea TaxID=2608001 RepID=A0A5M6CNZ8_9BACT|nr:hypothetical protein [Taibaiella lutea]KAA5536951.1 hypothetical protein F0919_04565 [Taibaiella lutea]
MKKILTILSIGILFAACSKKKNPVTDPAAVFNCQNFKTGITTDMSDMVGTEVNKLCLDLMPAASSPSDEYGQSQNINILVQRLSEKCDVTATLVCYACIETLPAQSEIRISINQNGTVYNRILDITVTQQNMLIYNGMHE